MIQSMKKKKKKKSEEVVAIKEAEKKRAKRNRDLFRDIMQDLNTVVSTETLSTNKCLSTAVSILTLDKFCKEKPADQVDHSQKDLGRILKARNCVGLGINDTGTIVYTSPNFMACLGHKECVIGDHISKVMVLGDKVLRKIFEDNICYILCLMHNYNSGAKSLEPFSFYGKIHNLEGGGRLYLGYAETCTTIYHNPVDLFQINETVLNADFTFSGPRNILLDNLLGYPEFRDTATEHVLSEDLMALSNNQTQFFLRHGYSHHLSRLLCADKTLLYVMAKVFIHNDEDGNVKLVSYNWPFAFSTYSTSTIEDNMRFLCKNDYWIALFPSFAASGPYNASPYIPGSLSPIPEIKSSPSSVE